MDTSFFVSVYVFLNTLFDALFGSVTKTKDVIYLSNKSVVIALFPAKRSFSFLQYRESVFSSKKKYVKPSEEALKNLCGLFRYNSRLKDCYIIDDTGETTIRLKKYSLENGIIEAGTDNQTNIALMIHSGDRTPGAVNAKFYFPVLVS